MSRPKAYDPVEGYRYQLFYKHSEVRELDHLDYAKDQTELFYLLEEYHLCMTPGTLRYLQLPKQYWPKEGEPT
ncbi:hypothetical protein [Exiguobacterium artemiae]|uniref:hypothetical protein n=1 Tax=Exiguobacterium artemiae TaxID=340145 RepID=UPI0029643B83|nr:hypothetical protein [Exiguobacterium sibiricum]MDW2886683.1 hypothetical protein [Exiguobacterium sibiricum]